MKPTRTTAAQPQPQPANEAPQNNAPAHAFARDAFPFATHDVLFAFAFLRTPREDK